MVFADRVAGFDSTHVTRLRAAGAVLAAQTTASEFGGVNCTSTKLHGVTRNPWDVARTPGGSSGGSAAAVAGGLLPIATGGDGGGSIRIPAGFTGLVGLKATYGRIPRGPATQQPPLTVTLGCMARSVRDTARWFDVCNGYDSRDTLSLPGVGGWEADLGSVDVAGKRAVISVDLGSAIVEPRVAALVVGAAEALIADAGLRRVDVVVQLPGGSLEWALSNLVGLVAELGDRYPDCDGDLTPDIQIGMNLATHHYDIGTAGKAELFRIDLNERMADVFDQADLILCATNPDIGVRRRRAAADHRGRRRSPRHLRLRTGHRQQRGPHDPGQPGRPAGRVGPHRDGGRAPGRDADHRSAPRGAGAAGTGPDRRAGAAVAPRGPVGPGLTVGLPAAAAPFV